MLRTVFVASCLAILPQAGWAADSGSSTETEDWSGFYVGANAGFVWGNGDIIVPEYDPPANAIRFNGPRAGLFSGFSWQPQDRVVFGLELGANWLDGNGDTALTRTGEQFTVSQDWELSAVARLGTPVASHLVYGLAGASWTRFAGAFPDQPATSDWVAGWTVGAGVEHAFSHHLRGRLEYRYADYGDADFTCEECGAVLGDLATHSISAGVLWSW